MLRLMKVREERERLGKQMRRWALKYHSQKACYETYLGFYKELLGE